LISYLDFKVFTGKFTNDYIENQKNVDAIAPNVRRYVHVAVASQWHVFLQTQVVSFLKCRDGYVLQKP